MVCGFWIRRTAASSSRPVWPNTENGWPPKRVEPRRLCHVVLNTAQFEQIVASTPTSWVSAFRTGTENQMAFLRCSRKHHVISFNRADHASVNHVAYMMADVDGVMRGLSNLRAHGQEPDWGPGRHGPATIFSVITKTPWVTSPSTPATWTTSTTKPPTKPPSGGGSPNRSTMGYRGAAQRRYPEGDGGRSRSRVGRDEL